MILPFFCAKFHPIGTTYGPGQRTSKLFHVSKMLVLYAVCIAAGNNDTNNNNFRARCFVLVGQKNNNIITTFKVVILCGAYLNDKRRPLGDDLGRYLTEWTVLNAHDL